jgi:hypothetical protein
MHRECFSPTAAWSVVTDGLRLPLKLKPVVTQAFTLKRVVEAHDLIRRNATAGRLVLDIGE